jgi:hypothetical protein
MNPYLFGKMKLFHPGLQELLYINNYLTDHNLAFLTIEVPLPNWVKAITYNISNYSLGLHIRREYRHLIMGLQSLQFHTFDSIYVMEIYNQHLFLLLPLLSLTNKNIFLGLHGNQISPNKNIITASGFKLLKRQLKKSKKFKVVLLELDDSLVDPAYQLPDDSKIVIPHPIIREAIPRLQLGERLAKLAQIRIGVVGIIRPDKPIKKVLDHLVKYVDKNPNCEIIVGAPIKQKPQFLNNLKVTLLDTTRQQDYLDILKTIDILVTDYDRDSYFYRASGVISDGGSCGCYILANDYPVIRQQITWPVSIGQVFSSLDELESLLDQAIIHVRQNGQDNHWQWREKRGAEYIAKLLFPES